MRLAYLECFAGAAGDMFQGALLDAGVPAAVLEDAVRALNIGASLQIEKVDRSGITATKVHVLDHGRVADARDHTLNRLERSGGLIDDARYRTDVNGIGHLAIRLLARGGRRVVVEPQLAVPASAGEPQSA